MTILDRIRRITQAGIHDALDKAEDAERMTRQRIRELEKAVGDAKRALAEYTVSFKMLQKELEQARWLGAEWQQKAESSVKLGDEITARKALAEKLKASERAAALEPSVQRSEATYKELRESLATMNDQLRDAKLRLSELASRKQAADAQKTFSRSAGSGIDGVGDDADFNRLEEQVLQSEAAADIERESGAGLRDVLADLDNQTRDLKVDSELEALKKKMGNR